MGVGDLTEYGLPVPDEGVFSRMDRLGLAPAIVDEEVIDAIKARRIEVVTGSRHWMSPECGSPTAGRSSRMRSSARRATAANSSRSSVTWTCCGPGGTPRAVGEDPAAPGLRFIGYVPRPGQLGHTAKQAKRAAKAIARELRVAG